MATYIILGQFTDQGIRNVKDTAKRADAFKELAKKAGGSVKGIGWTLGQYELLASVEAPDDATMTGMLLTLGGLGNVRTQSLRAFSADEMGRITAKLS